MNIQTLKKNIARLETQKNQLQQKQLELLKKQMLQCMQCLKRSQVGLWIFIQNMWYVQPSGCTEGYWHKYGTLCCSLVCPKCEKENYIDIHPEKEMIVQLTDNPFFGKHNIFKEVITRKID